MDCSGCARNVKQALEKLDGVQSAEVFLSSEKAKIYSVGSKPGFKSVKKAVEDIGYRVKEEGSQPAEKNATQSVAKKTFRLFGLVFGGILLVVVGGEWLGLFAKLTTWIPFWVGVIIVLFTGYPVFKKVIAAARKGMVTPHALMALGSVTALLAGEWVTAAIVVFFMRTGDFIEGFTTEKARESLKSLGRLMPQQATVIRDGKEVVIEANKVKKGDHVLVRPGNRIPVDGTVLEGRASTDQSSITGESMPADVTAGSQVYTSSVVEGGRLLIRADAVGKDSIFGKVITMVEEAEAHKGRVQRFADRFSGYYLPVVAVVALLTYLLSGNLMATVAVMVVACACAFALATPVALLASIGANAKKGILIKGGKYIETLANADVLLIDKTGTLTFGRPVISDIVPLNGQTPGQILKLTASAERFSTHPLAKAVVHAAQQRRLELLKPESFEELAGIGVKASFGGEKVAVGNERMVKDLSPGVLAKLQQLKNEGATVITVQQNNMLTGFLTARDEVRNEIFSSLARLRAMNFKHIELLTGDNKETAQELAKKLKVDFRAELLPQDKIEIVKKYQSGGHTVVMIGDGINDAPALAQADVGIALGSAATDVALDTADINLMQDNWELVPALFHSSKRTMRIVKGNFGFTTLYNIAGLSLAAFGFLPPVLAAAAQSIPDIGIMLNSSRLLKS